MEPRVSTIRYPPASDVCSRLALDSNGPVSPCPKMCGSEIQAQLSESSWPQLRDVKPSGTTSPPWEKTGRDEQRETPGTCGVPGGSCSWQALSLLSASWWANDSIDPWALPGPAASFCTACKLRIYIFLIAEKNQKNKISCDRWEW